MAGKVLWRKRKELPGFLNPLNENPFKNTITTEIIVTSRPRPQRGVSGSSQYSTQMMSLARDHRGFSGSSHKSTQIKPPPRVKGGYSDSSDPSGYFHRFEESKDFEHDFSPYSVNIEVGQNEDRRRPSLPDLMRMRTITREVAVNEMNAEAWLYARTSFLFFLALLITWVCLLLILLWEQQND